MIIAAALVILLGVFLFMHANPKSAYAPVTKTANVTVVTKTIKDENTQNRYTIDVQYPFVNGLDAQKQNDVNGKIQMMVTKLVNDFKSSATASAQAPFVKQYNLKSGLTVRFETGQVSSKIISLQLNVSDYQAGAAHPNNYNLTFNYDVAEGKQLKISDLFKSGDYVNTLSKLATDDLLAQYKKMNLDYASFVKDGASAKAENFQEFLLKQNNLVLVFNPYQVGPGAAGTRTVTTPLSQLSTILKPQYAQ